MGRRLAVALFPLAAARSPIGEKAMWRRIGWLALVAAAAAGPIAAGPGCGRSGGTRPELPQRSIQDCVEGLKHSDGTERMAAAQELVKYPPRELVDVLPQMTEAFDKEKDKFARRALKRAIGKAGMASKGRRRAAPRR